MPGRSFRDWLRRRERAGRPRARRAHRTRVSPAQREPLPSPCPSPRSIRRRTPERGLYGPYPAIAKNSFGVCFCGWLITAGSGRLLRQREMLDLRRHREERADESAPLGEERTLAEVDRVVLERVPANHQQVALGRLDALVHLVRAVAHGLRDDRREAALDRGLELGVLSRRDADVGDFENHGVTDEREGRSV